jgi:hypothetical protein
MVLMPQILFAGFFVPPTLIPAWLRWLTYVFPLAYGVKIVLVAEFDGACDGYEVTQSTSYGPQTVNYCDAILANVQAYPEDVWWYWLVLCGQFIFFRGVALILLYLKSSKFY